MTRDARAWPQPPTLEHHPRPERSVGTPASRVPSPDWQAISLSWKTDVKSCMLQVHAIPRIQGERPASAAMLGGWVHLPRPGPRPWLSWEHTGTTPPHP